MLVIPTATKMLLLRNIYQKIYTKNTSCVFIITKNDLNQCRATKNKTTIIRATAKQIRLGE